MKHVRMSKPIPVKKPTIAAPTRTKISPRSRLYFPPGDDIWIEVYDHVDGPIEQVQFAVDELSLEIAQSTLAKLFALHSDDSGLAIECLAGVPVRTLERIEDCNDLVISWVWNLVTLRWRCVRSRWINDCCCTGALCGTLTEHFERQNSHVLPLPLDFVRAWS